MGGGGIFFFRGLGEGISLSCRRKGLWNLCQTKGKQISSTPAPLLYNILFLATEFKLM